MKRLFTSVTGLSVMMALIGASSGTAHAGWSAPSYVPMHLTVRATNAAVTAGSAGNVEDPNGGGSVLDSAGVTVTYTWSSVGDTLLPPQNDWDLTHSYTLSWNYSTSLNVAADGIEGSSTAMFSRSVTTTLAPYHIYSSKKTYNVPLGSGSQSSTDPLPTSGSERHKANYNTVYDALGNPTTTVSYTFYHAIAASSKQSGSYTPAPFPNPGTNNVTGVAHTDEATLDSKTTGAMTIAAHQVGDGDG